MLNLYAGLEFDVSKYTVELSCYIFIWQLFYKKTNNILLISVGPFSVVVYDNKHIEESISKKLFAKEEETDLKE